MDKKEFAKMLIESRLKRGLSVKETAKQIGCTEKSYQKWEDGVRMPSIRSLALIRELFNLPLEIMVIGLQD